MKHNNNLKRIRKEHYLTTQELANVIGISRQFITTIENGYRPIPKKLALKLANYFNISVDALYGVDSIKVATDVNVAFKNLIAHFRQTTICTEEQNKLFEIVEHLIDVDNAKNLEMFNYLLKMFPNFKNANISLNVVSSNSDLTVNFRKNNNGR